MNSTARPATAFALAVLTLLLGSCASRQAFDNRRTSSHDATSVQALIGATLFDDLSFDATDPNDPNNKATAEVSQAPLLGFAGQYRLTGDRDFEAGLDGNLLFSWWKDSAEVRATGGGTAVISISTRMFLTDIGFGFYAAKVFGDVFRIYAGVGPLLLFGYGKLEDNTSLSGSSSENGFGVGGYARAGAEFRLDRNSFLGFGVRGITSNVDFGGQLGTVDVDGLQMMLTYTVQF